MFRKILNYNIKYFEFTWVKAVPLQAWSSPEGSRKLRFSDFMTTIQDGGKVVNLSHRPPLSPLHYERSEGMNLMAPNFTEVITA